MKIIRPILKNTLVIVILSTLFSSIFLVGIYEILATIRYYQWKSYYHQNGDLYGHLTVKSNNNELIWEYRPYGECITKTKNYNGEELGIIKTNRYGFRDYDYESPEKPQGIYRIAFIGDSVTLGLWVPFEKTFVRRFEAEANRLKKQTKYQAVNFAVDGYDTRQISAMLKTKVLLFAPDKVVYVMCLNDFDFDEASGLKIKYFVKPRSFLLQRIKKAYHHRNRPKDLDYHLYHYKKNREIVFTKILEMKSLLDRENISFHLSLLPVFDLEYTNFETYPLRNLHKEVTEFALKNDISFSDLLKTFSNQKKSPHFVAYDAWHPNEEGHLVIAHGLSNSIIP